MYLRGNIIFSLIRNDILYIYIFCFRQYNPKIHIMSTETQIINNNII